MKTIVTSTLLILINIAAFAQSKDVEAIKKLNEDWINSYPTKDRATLDKIFADDFVLISPRGIPMSRRAVLESIPKQETTWIRIDSAAVKMVTPDVGVITAYITFAMKEGDQETKARNCYQDVYVKRGGKWQAVSAHVTLLSTP
jgi:uncharacterized protein (TIGR02246 family)